MRASQEVQPFSRVLAQELDDIDSRRIVRQQPVQKVWQGQRENFRGSFRYFMDDLISESRNGQHRTICR